MSWVVKRDRAYFVMFTIGFDGNHRWTWCNDQKSAWQFKTPAEAAAWTKELDDAKVVRLVRRTASVPPPVKT